MPEPNRPSDRPPDAPPQAASAASVLILDPEPGSGRDLERALRAAGCEAGWLRDVKAFLRRISSGGIDVAIVDEATAGERALLEEIAALPDAPAIVVVSEFGTVEGAVRAMRDGASHYASKPIEKEEIELAVRKAAGQRRLHRENRTMRAELEKRAELGSLVVRDARMREVFALLETASQTRATILLHGESGTGKSVIARAIHTASPRRTGPFVEVNCGALPEQLLESELFGHARGAFTGAVRDRAGRFEVASGGTIFLDEIGTSSPSLQVRLLRVLQERVVERVGEAQTRPVDVRVVLATYADLEEEVRAGRFREDLYYRIHVVAVEIPPLRDRPVDIPDLAAHFLRSASAALGRPVRAIAPDAMARLVRHRWPGNVRELENAIEHAVAIGAGDRVESRDLPRAVGAAGQDSAASPGGSETPASDASAERIDDVPLGRLEDMLAVCERRFLERALASTHQSRTRAAELLGLHRATLYQRMRRVGLDPTQRP